MELALVQEAVEAWTAEDQDHLAAYLSVLRLQRTTDHSDELSRRLDDRDPGNWLTLSELKDRLSRADGSS
jgi:hypothetical protein